jgi:hypothetical protein
VSPSERKESLRESEREKGIIAIGYFSRLRVSCLMELLVENEVSDGEDDWYNRMEEEAMKTDTYEVEPDVLVNEVDRASGPVTEEAYFDSVQRFNETNDSGFIGEKDPIWYHMMKDAAKSTMQAAATVSTGMLVQLRREDVSSLILCRNWVFGFLPHSCKMYLELCHCCEGEFNNQQLFTDNIVHPSIIASFVVREDKDRVEVSFYSPYKAHEVAFPAFFKVRDTLYSIRLYYIRIYYIRIYYIPLTTRLSSTLPSNHPSDARVHPCHRQRLRGDVRLN